MLSFLSLGVVVVYLEEMSMVILVPIQLDCFLYHLVLLRDVWFTF